MAPGATTPIGTLDSQHLATLDRRGRLAPAGGGWSLDWWIGAEDRWHVPAAEADQRVRQALLDDAPVVETFLRVPGGEVVHRAFAARVDGHDHVIVDIENGSHVPVGVALALRGDPAIALPRAPATTADAAGLTVHVYPLAHTATLRIALPLDGGALDAGALARAPSGAQVARGWRAQTDRGMRVVVPDERLQHALDASRCFVLLEAGPAMSSWAAVARVLPALDAWGFADEAARLRLAYPLRARRAGRRRRRDRVSLPTWGDIEVLLAAPSTGPDLLVVARDALVREEGDACLALGALAPDAWLGQGVEVHDAPTSHGLMSYAVRWHGARPALLWERTAPPDRASRAVRITAPALDPAWSSTEARGEALLAPVEPAGGLPKVYGPVEVSAGSDAPDAGGSFA